MRVSAPGEFRWPQERAILSGWAAARRAPAGELAALLLPGDRLEPGPEAGGSVEITALTCLVVTAGRRLEAADRLGEARRTIARFIAEKADEPWLSPRRLPDRETAEQKVIHLLLELHRRLSGVGLADDDGFRIPLTQEILSEWLGLRRSEMNRALRALSKAALIKVKPGAITFVDRAALVATC